MHMHLIGELTDEEKRSLEICRGMTIEETMAPGIYSIHVNTSLYKAMVALDMTATIFLFDSAETVMTEKRRKELYA